MAGTQLGGIVTAQRMSVACTAAQVETADGVLATMEVPTDAVILDVRLTVTDMDSSTGLLIDVGDAAGPATPDDDRFIAAFTGQAAGSIAAAGEGNLLADSEYAYTAASSSRTVQEIEATVNTVATTGVAGTLTLTAIYFRP